MSYYKRVQHGKEVVAKLKSGRVKFKVAGFRHTFQMSVPTDENGVQVYAVYDSHGFGDGMNVDEFGATQMKLYTYDIFSNGTTQIIKYEDIEFIEEEA